MVGGEENVSRMEELPVDGRPTWAGAMLNPVVVELTVLLLLLILLREVVDEPPVEGLAALVLCLPRHAMGGAEPRPNEELCVRL
jgi:hypothetical protein